MNFFDLHCDTPYECFHKKQPFYRNSLAVSGEKGAVFERWTQCFAIWIRDDAEQPFKLYKNILNDFRQKLVDRPSNLTPLITVEGGAVIEDDIGRVEVLKNDGIKAITLTWNGQNRIAGGADTDAGLTDFGREVIVEMNRLGILCDLSHLNRKSFYSALEYAEKPIATHSCCSALLDHRRNLSDEQLLLIAQKGGTIGLCLYPEFAGHDVFNGIYRNIMHLCELGLENHIAIGSDFDGAKMDIQLKSVDNIPDLYAYLEQKDIEKAVLDKIFYNNAEKIFVSL